MSQASQIMDTKVLDRVTFTEVDKGAVVRQV